MSRDNHKFASYLIASKLNLTFVLYQYMCVWMLLLLNTLTVFGVTNGNAIFTQS